MKTSRALRALAALVLAAAAAPTVARAQAADAPSTPVRPLSVGDPIRLVSVSGSYTGTLAGLGVDTVMVAARGANVGVLRSNVREVYRSANRATRGPAMRRGALYGLAAGLAIGFVAGEAAGKGDLNALGAFTAEGGLLGALVGTMVGPSFRHEEWERVELPPPSGGVSAAAQRD